MVISNKLHYGCQLAIWQMGIHSLVPSVTFGKTKHILCLSLTSLRRSMKLYWF